MPSSSIFHRSLDKTYDTAVGGEGIFLIKSNGDKVLDGCSGAAVSCLGHNNQEVIDAIVAQTRKLSFAHTSVFTSDPAEKLAKVVLDASDGAFSKLLFVSSGSEAVEATLKLARQYHIFNGEPDRIHIIGRQDSYHGNTLGALAVGNNSMRRPNFAPLLSPAFRHVGRCFYSADGKGRDELAYENELISEYEDMLEQLGPQTVAAIVVEPVVGATLGAVPATGTYLPRLKTLCERYGVLMVYDEVMCGMGRTGTYHAWQSLGGVAPDLQSIGKGLGAGYQPISAVLIGEKVYQMFEKHSKGAHKFVSGHTFQGHSAGCACALTVQTILKRDDLLTNVKEMGELLRSTLRNKLPVELFSHGASVRGLGLLIGVDFGATGEQYGGPLCAQVLQEAYKLGLAVYPCSSSVDAILLAPPFIINAQQVEFLARTLTQALRTVLAERGHKTAAKI